MIPMSWRDWIRGCVIAAVAGAIPTLSSVYLHPDDFIKNWKEHLLTALVSAGVGVRVFLIQAPLMGRDKK
jgi:hypothetical protein